MHYVFLAHLGELLWSPFVRRPASVNFFSSVTSGSIGMKLHRKHPLNDLTRWILVSMATQWKKLQNFSSPKLVGRFSNNFVEMFLGNDPLSDSFKPCWLVEKHSCQGGYFALYGYSEKSSQPKVSSRFSNNFVEMCLGWLSIRFLQAMLIGRKTWPPGGREGVGAILPYISIVKTLKIFFSESVVDFQIIL